MFGIDDAALAIGGSSIVSGLLGSEASGRAADVQANATNNATAAQREMYSTTRADLSPYREAGTSALQRLMYLTGIGTGGPTLAYKGASDLVSMDAGIPAMNQRYANDPTYVNAWNQVLAEHRANQGGRSYTNLSDANAIANAVGARLRSQNEADSSMAGYASQAKNDPAYGSLMKDFTLADFQKDPGYDFRLAEGEKAINRAMTSRGLSSSTPGLQSLLKYNQDYASGEFQNAYGRFRDSQGQKFNLLSYLSGGGQNAAAMTGQAGTAAAGGIASSMMAGGAAQAAGVVGSASAINNAIQGGLGNYMYQQRFDQMMQRMPVFSAANDATSTMPLYGMPRG